MNADPLFDPLTISQLEMRDMFVTRHEREHKCCQTMTGTVLMSFSCKSSAMKTLIVVLFLLLNGQQSGQQLTVPNGEGPNMPLPDLLYVISPFFQRVNCE